MLHITEQQPPRYARPQSPPPLVYLGMALLLLIPVWLGVRGLDADPVWSDEMISIEHVGGHIHDGFHPVDTWHAVKDRSRAHSPGYFLLLDAWAEVAGWSPVALRYLALLLGLTGVAWTYRLGRDTVSWQVGLIAAVLMGTSAFFTYYLHELRMYSANATVVIFALWIYHRVLVRPHTLRWYEWIALFAGAMVPLYTHYFAGLVLGVIGGYHVTFAFHRLVVQRSTRNVPRWIWMAGMMGLAGISFLPWIRTAVSGLDAVHGASVTLSETALNPVELLHAILERFGNGATLFSLLGMALAAVAGFRQRRDAIFIWATAAALLVGVVGVNVIERVIPARRLRYITVLWPSLSLVIALGLASLRRWRWLTPLLVLVWAAIGINASLGRDIVRDQGGAITFFPLHEVDNVIEPMITPDDALLTFGEVSDHWGAKHFTSPAYYFEPLTPHFWYVDDDLEPEIEPILTAAEEHQRIWVVYQHGQRTQRLDAFVAALDPAYQLADTFNGEDDLRVELYVR